VPARCCVVGGGPAGIMLGYLLARSGVDVVVLEKHADFFRDFRGDTIHPSTLNVMDELGLLDDLLALPHSEIRSLSVNIGGKSVPMVDLRYLPGRCKFVAFMPQWDFLNFLSERARGFPAFDLRMQHEAVDLLRESDRYAGVAVQTPSGRQEIAADVVIACDGRHSIVRSRAALPVREIGAPIDALWMRLSKKRGDPEQTFGNIVNGGILVAIDRRDYYQCAFVIRKGGIEELQRRGIEAFRAAVAEIAPFLEDRVGEIRSWDDVKLLTVRIDRLVRWFSNGLLCIGDAAHAMSPVGGVGINLAIQDAIACANILTRPLLARNVSEADLRAVQRRREFPARVTQRAQEIVQDRLLTRILNAREPIHAPGIVKAFRHRRAPGACEGVNWFLERFLPSAYSNGTFEITGESLFPLGSIPIGNAGSGIQSANLSYADATARYWFRPGRWAIGVGETLWNQQTKYLNTVAPVELDASRGAGVRYELVNEMPMGVGSIRLVAAADPRIHARLSWTFQPPIVRRPVSEQESQIDVSASYLRPLGRRWTIDSGLRYLNLAAKYDDGAFAGANHVTGAFATVLWTVAP
jgi:2-polyprenyl-6-methoxyphenol hydroxylase-like FAD-dependent oxidoreductase